MIEQMKICGVISFFVGVYRSGNRTETTSNTVQLMFYCLSKPDRKNLKRNEGMYVEMALFLLTGLQSYERI